MPYRSNDPSEANYTAPIAVARLVNRAASAMILGNLIAVL
jgi:hypothetical protein